LLWQEQTHINLHVSSSLYQDLMFWLLDGSTKTVKEDDKLFVVNLRMPNRWLYNHDLGLVLLIKVDNMGCLIDF
jgi:hypothetical protein